MSAITVDGDLVHYEKLGRGRPVVLLHGWLGSWRYWIPLMKQIQLKYSVYAIDLFGFGDSSKNEAHYTLDQQVMLLTQFMEKLGIPKAVMIGHGLGALVIAEYAKANPTKVHRAMFTSLPLFDTGNLGELTPPGVSVPLTAPRIDTSAVPKTETSTPPVQSTEPESPATKSDDITVSSVSAGRSVSADNNSDSASMPVHEMDTLARPSETDIDRERLQAARQQALANPSQNPASQEETLVRRPSGLNERLGKNHLLELMAGVELSTLLGKAFKRSESHYEKLKVDVDKTDNKVLTFSIKNYDALQILNTIRRLPMPIAIVHGEDDPVLPVPPESVWDYLTRGQDDLLLPIPLSGVRHFPMIESVSFLKLADDFLKIEDVSKLEVKERWYRPHR